MTTTDQHLRPPSALDTLVDKESRKSDVEYIAPTTSFTNDNDEKTVQEGTSNRQSTDEKRTIQQDPLDEKQYLTGMKLFLVFLGFLLAVFLFALDQTIVATAQPRIISQFNALDQIAWISSAYFLTQAGLILPFGQILTIASTKYTFLVAIFLFELGSLFCAVAWNVNFLIFGRAVAGSGAAGMFVAILSIIAQVTRLEDRPLLFGSFGGVFAIASAVGPLLGGAFTDHVSWRWCFYINLPFGAIAILVVCLVLDNPKVRPNPLYAGMSTLQKWLSLDFVGTALILSVTTTLLLALQWGGNTKPWNSGSVIACLVLFGVLTVVFIVWEYRLGDRAMLPTKLLKRWTQVGTALEAFFIFLGLLVGTYYLPLWYQAQGQSASKSGINILAFMLSLVAATGASGAIINKTGRYWPFLFFTPLISSVGAGLLFTIHPDTPHARVIGFQILFGVGLGGALQNTIIAIQTEYALEEDLIPQGTSIVNFVQILGGVIGITIGASVFGNQLAQVLPKLAPGLDSAQEALVRSSVTGIFTLPKELQAGVIQAYSYSLNRVFLMSVPGGFLASCAALLVKNYNIRERSPTGGMGGGLA